MSSFRVSLLLALVACAEVAPVVVAEKTVEPAPLVRPEPPTLRLPPGVTPLSYELAATVVPSSEKVLATVRIRVRFEVRTDRVWLNATNLTYTEAYIDTEKGRVGASAKNEGTYFAVLTLERPVEPGEATIVVSSSAPIMARESEGAISFQSGGETYVYTQLESLGARRIFPCFDEPGYKVPWQVTLTVPKALTALSNTSQVSQTDDGALKTIRFAQTKPLPSYLLAFVVGPFDIVDAGVAGQNNVPIRIVTAKGQGARAAYAVANAGEALERLEKFFGTPMPYDKLDLVGLASPAGFDGMENPGLITFDESTLLAGLTDDTIRRQRGFMGTLVHEIAHMWFGDWVTMKWWNDVWLNEAFASWMESRILNEWKPDWGGELNRVIGQNGVMGADSLSTSRKIRQPIQSHDDILNSFDGITYGKGEAVLNMFETWLGPATFQKGIQLYLSKKPWGNADVTDFLSAMSEVSGRDVTVPFSSFIDQVGVPLVSAKLDCSTGVKLTLSQKRFVPLGSVGEAQLWHVPVCVRWESGQKCLLLETAEKTFELEAKTCPKWLLPNAGMAGFYRSAPLDPLLVGNPALTPSEQLGVLHDVNAAAEMGELSLADVMKTVPLLAKAKERQLAEQAVYISAQVNDVLPIELKPKLAAWVQSNLGARTRSMGLSPKKGESDDDRLLRLVLARGVGTLGEDKALQREAVKLVRAWLTDRNSLSTEALTVVLSLSSWSNDPTLFDGLMAAAMAEKDPGMRRRLFMALGSYRTPTLAARARALAFEPTLAHREVFTLISPQAHMPETSRATFDWAKANYDTLVKRLPADWEAYLIDLGANECTDERKAEVEAFFKERTLKAVGGAHQYAQTMESMDQCIAWKKRQQPVVSKFFK